VGKIYKAHADSLLRGYALVSARPSLGGA
jgi:hypothetical protein